MKFIESEEANKFNFEPFTTEGWRKRAGKLPTTTDMGQAIADAAMDRRLPSGHTIVVGGALDTLVDR